MNNGHLKRVATDQADLPGASSAAGEDGRVPVRRFDSDTALSLTRSVSGELRRAARKARTPRPVTLGGGGFRARRGDKLFRFTLVGSFLGIVVVPILLASLYFGLLASDQFVTEAQFTVQSGETNGLESLDSISAALGGAKSTDALMLAEYINSRAAIEEIGQMMDIRSLFDGAEIDWLARLDPRASVEDFTDYWRRHVDVAVNRTTGIVTLTVRAFAPDHSFSLANAIVSVAERTVNQIYVRQKTARLSEARIELDQTQKRLADAVSALGTVRDEAGLLDVETASRAYGDIVTALQIQLARVQQEIDANAGTISRDSPQAKRLEARAMSLREQIASYEAALAGSNDAPSIAARAGGLRQSEIELEIARKEYTAATIAYERARMEMERQASYLVTFVPPQLAQDSLYPRRWLMWGIVVVGACLIWSILAGIAILIRDYTAG